MRRAVRAAADLVLHGLCGACGCPGTPLCGTCRAGVRTLVDPAALAVGEGLRCWSAGTFEGPLAAAVPAYKDGGRRDLAPVLAGLLGIALALATHEDDVLRRARAGASGVLVVPVPPAPRARRRRGDDPVGALVRRAVREVSDPDLSFVPVLRHTRRVADQAGLGRRDRAANLAGALAVRPGVGEAVRGAVCLVVDDVLTTGATLAEAARALRSGGAEHVSGAVLVRRERPHSGSPCGPQGGRLASLHEASPLEGW